MKALFLSPSLSRNAGGIFEIEKSLARALSDSGLEIQALGLNDSNWKEDQAGWAPLDAGVVPVVGPSAFGYAPKLVRRVMESSFDLLHLHAMWMYPSIVAHRAAKICKKPLIVTPNGMLEPWALKNSAWKKKTAGFLYENRMLHGAACLQANTEKELLDFRAYGLKNPVCIIPNGVDLPEIIDHKSEVSKEKKTLLFLGRLHPKKGLVNALKAWGKVLPSTSNEWRFVIAGWDQGGHEAELKQLCTEIGLAHVDIPSSVFTANRQGPSENYPSVIFLGPTFGHEKDTLLRSASAFILPSFSEGFPMSVLEAWSYRLPVLMTEHCNMPGGFTAGASLRIGTSVESIAEGMVQFLKSRHSDLQSLGINGRTLVEHQFTWPMIAAQLKEVYEWVLGGGGKPGCVND